MDMTRYPDINDRQNLLMDNRIAYLIKRRLDGSSTPEEREELSEWAARTENDALLNEALEQGWHEYEPGADIHALAAPALDRIEAKLFGADRAAATATVPAAATATAASQLASAPAAPSAKLVPFRRRMKTSWMVAAAILILVVAGIDRWLVRPAGKTNLPAATASASDIQPGRNKAILTLEGGDRIDLDSAANGVLAAQGNTRIEKLPNGKLTYRSVAPATKAALNTLTTPRGGQYQLVLPDGTKVWLNAASSITYPVAFTGRQRKVTITGEAYFEVKTDPALPFIVDKGDMTIEVLGTHFDVNTYDDEQAMKVTLLEGAVNVHKGNTGQLLKPGQQAQVARILPSAGATTSASASAGTAASVTVSNDVNAGEVMAWKNGSFYFNRTPLPVVLRQLSRWYDVDIVYEGAVPNLPFGGEMGRDLSLNQVLNILGKMGMQYRLEGKKLIVLAQ
jgi:ferric-dicitrate binding protein FerR (iron transport regulator)